MNLWIKWCLLTLLVATAAGCNILGVAASMIPPPPIKAVYRLEDRQVGIMVWADRGLRIDWPGMQRDLAGGVQSRLQQAINANNDAVRGATFPVSVESLIRFQRDNPGIEALPITDIAPQLGVPVLIYIEIKSFSTRAPRTPSMFRGSAVASLRVVEVVNGVGKTVFQEEDITVVWPVSGTEDGSPRGNDTQYYVGTISTLADELAARFVDRPGEN
jgi:hypothetical protein